MADETYPVLGIPQQSEVYSHTKGIADELVLASNKKYGAMLTVSIRPPGIFGEGDVQNLPNILQIYYNGKTKFQLGDNRNRFDFTYVGNVTNVHILAAQKLMETWDLSVPPPESKRVDGEAFLITNDDPYNFWTYARTAWAAAGDKTDPKDMWMIPKSVGLMMATILEWMFWLLFCGRKQPGTTRQKVKFSCMTRTYSINKAKSRLGYKPLWGKRKALEGEWNGSRDKGQEDKKTGNLG